MTSKPASRSARATTLPAVVAVEAGLRRRGDGTLRASFMAGRLIVRAWRRVKIPEQRGFYAAARPAGIRKRPTGPSASWESCSRIWVSAFGIDERRAVIFASPARDRRRGCSWFQTRWKPQVSREAVELEGEVREHAPSQSSRSRRRGGGSRGGRGTWAASTTRPGSRRGCPRTRRWGQQIVQALSNVDGDRETRCTDGADDRASASKSAAWRAKRDACSGSAADITRCRRG